MLRGRTRGVVVIVVATMATACETGIQVGGGGTTTTIAPTTVAPPPSTTTTAPKAKAKPKAASSARTPASIVAQAEGAGEAIVVDPRAIEPFLVVPDLTWTKESDRTAGTGPLDLDGAAAEDAEDTDRTIEEVRSFLESIGFLAGYSREWQKSHAHKDTRMLAHDAAFLFSSLYLFSTPEGARAQFEADVADLEELTADSDVQPITVGAVPGSRAWSGGNDSDGHLAVVVFAKDEVSARVLCRSTSSRFDYRSCVMQFSKAQYDRV